MRTVPVLEETLLSTTTKEMGAVEITLAALEAVEEEPTESMILMLILAQSEELSPGTMDTEEDSKLSELNSSMDRDT